MRGRFFTAAIAAVVLMSTGVSSADVAFPARLDVVETEVGVYEISFTLPIIEGRKLRAEPLMPPTCTELAPPEIGSTATGYLSTWSVRCEPASLAGEAILIEGLLGTQTDLAFSLTTLDGRTYSRILRPSRPGFLVPEPPSPAALSASAIIEGARGALRHPGLWGLMLVVVFLGADRRDLRSGLGALVAGHLVAQWMAAEGWLEVSQQARDLVLWSAIALPAIRLAEGDGSRKTWFQPLWPPLLLLGLVFGGSRPEALPTEGLSTVEQLLVLVFYAVGIGLAAALICAVAWELRRLAELTGGGRRLRTMTATVGYVAGAVAAGLILVHCFGLVLRSGDVHRSVMAYVLLALVAGPYLALSGHRQNRTVVGFGLLAIVGAILGLLRVPLPMATTWTLGSMAVMGLVIAAARPLPRRWMLMVAAVAVPAHTWHMAANLVADVSRSTAVTLGLVLLGICVFFGSFGLSRHLRFEDLKMPVRVFGGLAAAVAILWRLAEYRAWFEREVATEAALGLLRLPMLALILLVLAAVLWPRRRRVAEKLGVERSSKRWHLLLAGAAALLVPFGTVAVPNPFFEPRAPRGVEAQRVATRVLSDTYHAFNLTDEDRLYDTLAETVMGDLVDEIYLDSRRRLTAGTREGTQVTVREVGVLEIGDPLGGSAAGEGVSYDCRWKVVARVQHLQHVHHRHNIYSGVLTLRPDEGRWKISGVELVSEDRVVVPWQPT